MAQHFLDITNVDIAKKIIQEIESEQNRARRKEDFDSHQIMSGNQREYVASILESKFPESFEVMSVSNINFLKKVNNKVATVYKEPPVRFVDGEKNENLDQIYKEGNFDKAFKSMDKIFNRSKCSLSWVQNVGAFKKKYRLVSLAQYTFDVVIDNDTLELLMVILSYPGTDITTGSRQTRSDSVNQIIAETELDSSATSKQYAIWTKEHHVNIFSVQTKATTVIDYMIDVDNPKMINRLGIIPFVWTTAEPFIPEYPTPNPLAKESININVMNSNLLTAAEKQIGVLMLKYPQGSKVNQIHKGFNVALELPQKTEQDPHIETSASYLVPNSDLEGMGKTFMEYTANVLSDSGLEGGSSAGESKDFSSGVDRLIASSSITDLREDNVSEYRTTEEKVFEIVKAYDKFNKTKLFNQEDKLAVVYKKQVIITTEADRIANVKAKDELGVLEEKDKFEEMFPSMSEKEIVKKMERIRQARQDKVDILMNDNEGDDTGASNS